MDEIAKEYDVVVIGTGEFWIGRTDRRDPSLFFGPALGTNLLARSTSSTAAGNM